MESWPGILISENKFQILAAWKQQMVISHLCFKSMGCLEVGSAQP